MKHRLTWRRAVCMLLCGVMLAGSMTGCEKKEASLSEEKIINYEMPANGDKVVVMTIKDYGDVKIRLFADECPKAVENFLGLVEKHYYDELIFHRVVKNFVIQGGDPKGNSTGGESLWGQGFEQEISPKLCHFNGALAYAVASDKLNNSQFYIVTGDKVTEQTFEQLSTYYGKTYSDQVKQMYYEHGGQPFLDGDYTVFGQVIDGLDICMKINEVAVDSNSKPKEQVTIESMKVLEYYTE